MHGCQIRVNKGIFSKTIGISFVISITLFAQTERWVYKYNGSGNADDMAVSITCGDDGNIYAAGQSRGNGSGFDFTIVSLLPDGTERWVYTYNGPGNADDIAKQIVYGLDGNIYACGHSVGATGSNDFIVISLTQSGAERWVYRYNGTGNGSDEASSIDFGLDGNVYAAGYCYSISSYQDFIVTSLDTAGSERWQYIYNAGQYPGTDFARSIVCGSDTNIYAAGQIYNWVTLEDFAMVSLRPDSTVRWVGLFDGNTITPPDYANAIAYGLDDEPYAAGLVAYWADGRPVFTVMNRQNAGPYGWVYEYQGSAVLRDEAYVITYGADHNVYTAGYTTNTGTARDFTIISLINDRVFNWIYLFNGTGNDNDEALDVEYGLDGYIYGCGICLDVIGQENLLVVRLDTSGTANWTYKYQGNGGAADRANSLVFGSDYNLYVAGYASDSISGFDFVVISLDTIETGIEDGFIQYQQTYNCWSASAFFRNQIALRNPNVTDRELKVAIYNIQGQKFYEHRQKHNSPQILIGGKSIETLPSGIYFIHIITEGYSGGKIIKVIKF